MPTRYESAQGGHAVGAYGYDDKRRLFLIRNSWGPGWAQEGYCWMPYPYLLHPGLSADFWRVTRMEA